MPRKIYTQLLQAPYSGGGFYRSTKKDPQALDQKHQKRKTRSRITLIGTSELLFSRTWCQQIQNEWQKLTSRNEVEEGMETDLIKVQTMSMLLGEEEKKNYRKSRN